VTTATANAKLIRGLCLVLGLVIGTAVTATLGWIIAGICAAAALGAAVLEWFVDRRGGGGGGDGDDDGLMGYGVYGVHIGDGGGGS
jgi:hypothetical protein